MRNKEHVTNINGTPATKRIIDITHAQCPFSYQSKMVASVFYKIDKPDRLWTVGLIGDYTFMNKGIGADILLALKINVMF